MQRAGHGKLTLEYDDRIHTTCFCSALSISYAALLVFYPLTEESLEQQERWIKNHKDYFTGLLRQVEIQRTRKKLTIEEYIDFRRQSIGAMPSCSLVEYAYLILMLAQVYLPLS